MTKRAPAWTLGLGALFLITGCPTANPHFKGSDGGSTTADGSIPSGTDASSNPSDGGTPRDGSTPGADATAPHDGGETGPRQRSCDTVVRYHSQPGHAVFLAGSFNAFQPTALQMLDPQGIGTYTASVALPPGVYPYKFVVDGNWLLDPSHNYRAYDSGVENSGLRVADCHQPLLENESASAVLDLAHGNARFVLRYTEANGGPGPDSNHLNVALRSGTSSRALTSSELSWSAGSWELNINLASLPTGKHTLSVVVPNQNGVPSNRVLLPFWVEAVPFDWRDALIYMAMTDRFRDGDPSNNPPRTANAVASADFLGGDLQGITASIRDGYFDQLGVKALWLTPFNTQPAAAFPDADNVHQVTGYHGYWPVEPRTVDPRIGGDAALLELSEVAHQHGIRLLMDFVINHVHQDHSYIQQHPDWFRTQAQGACICGGPDCDWTVHRLDCLFSPYLPNVVWQNKDASEQMIADAIYWVDHFDLDGLRVDAVKHVPDLAIFNLSTRIDETFETAGTSYYLIGETAMGWYDCNPADPTCNADNYGTISRYIGDHALKGQFDFVLFHGTAISVFGDLSKGMIHADVWSHASDSHYPPGAIMGKYVGSHDESRFVTKVAQPQLAGNKWPDQSLATQPSDEVPYQRLALAHTWNMTLAGAPLLYYGDEYGEFGSSDPDNRHMFRFDANRNAAERALATTVAAVGTARAELSALRRGEFITLAAPTETFWAYARSIPATQEAAVVVINRDAAPVTETVALSPATSLTAGTVLRDRIHGGTTMVTEAGTIVVMLPPSSAAILAPN